MKKRTGFPPWLLIPVGIIACLVWLREQFGNSGIVLIVVITIICLSLYSRKKNKKVQQDFDRLALSTLRTKRHWTEDKEINKSLMRHPGAPLIRNLQILRDSIEIALTSKKRDTAEQRMNAIPELFEEIKKHATLVSPEVFEEIYKTVYKAQRKFHTSFYINIATGYIESAEKVRTRKTKDKYFTLAAEALKEGLRGGLGNEGELNLLLAGIERMKASS